MIKRKKHFSFATAVVAGWRASGGGGEEKHELYYDTVRKKRKTFLFLEAARRENSAPHPPPEKNINFHLIEEKDDSTSLGGFEHVRENKIIKTGNFVASEKKTQQSRKLKNCHKNPSEIKSEKKF
jgi:hypothetical protein